MLDLPVAFLRSAASTGLQRFNFHNFLCELRCRHRSSQILVQLKCTFGCRLLTNTKHFYLKESAMAGAKLIVIYPRPRDIESFKRVYNRPRRRS
jgi:hypothetical protein